MQNGTPAGPTTAPPADTIDAPLPPKLALDDTPQTRAELVPLPPARPVGVPASRDPRTSPEFTPFACSEEIGALVGALTRAAMAFDIVEKNQTADVQSRREGARSYKYRYADLNAVISATRPWLSENGLAILQFPIVRQRTVTVLTLLAHTSGQWIRNDLPCVVDSLDPQAIGSATSYMRRYSQLSILNLAPAEGEEDDGRAAMPKQFNGNGGAHTSSHGHASELRPGQGPVTMPQRVSATPTNGGSPSPSVGPLPAAVTVPPVPAAPPAPAPDTFTVETVAQLVAENNAMYWAVKFSNGVRACTFEGWLGDQLVKARVQRTPFKALRAHKKGEWTYIDALIPAAGGGQ